MQEIEIEFKNMLSIDEYDSLKSKWFPNEKPITQINYYFETDDLQLKNKQASLRIREKNESYTATLKEDKGDHILETHLMLSTDEYINWLNNNLSLKDALLERLTKLSINIHQLKYRGSLTTHRLQKEENGMIIVIDHSEYNGKSDYELELETESVDEGKAYFHALLLENNISYRPSKNKVARFYDTLK